jgi:hypothetical protein
LKENNLTKAQKIKWSKTFLNRVDIEKTGSEIPYVVVSSRTGYFHG